MRWCIELACGTQPLLLGRRRELVLDHAPAVELCRVAGICGPARFRDVVRRSPRRARGLLQLLPHADDSVEIASFGLLPQFIGQGFGGQLLTGY